MGRRLSAADAEFYRRVDEVLHYLWDPCGVAGEPLARDEYGGYVGRVFSALKAGGGVEEIAEMLVGIEWEWMGGRRNREVIWIGGPCPLNCAD